MPSQTQESVSSGAVRRHFLFRDELFYVGLLLAVCAPVVVVIAGSLHARDQHFAERAVHGEGIVTGRSRSHTKSGWTNTIRYEYVVEDGSRHSGTGHVSDSKWAIINKGDSIPLEYLPESPDRSRLNYVSPEDLDSRGKILAAVGCALMIAGIALIGFRWSEASHRASTLLRGHIAEARITEVMHDVGVIIYSYEDDDGVPHEGRQSGLRGIDGSN